MVPMRIGSPSGFARAAWRATVAWFSNVPIEDPVDRRNAPIIQLVLIMFASLPPLLWLHRIVLVEVPWRPGETISLATSLVLSLIAASSLVLIRRGRFQWAVRQLLAVAAILMMLAYSGTGFAANRFEQPIQVVWLVLGGLVAGRRMMWLLYGWMVAAFVVGTEVDIERFAKGVDASWRVAGADTLISALIFLFIAIVIDRCVAALRESLAAATERGNALDRLNQRLHDEIAERERVRELLIHAQKVEAVGRLASGVAHDFNHLLSLILGYATRGAGKGDVEELRAALAGVESAAHRATAVTRKLLQFSRQDMTVLEVFDVVEALRGLQPMLRQLFDPSVPISLEVPDGPCPIRFDRAHFALVVLNLAANAKQAMPDGGRFRMVVQRREDTACVDVDFIDTGHGIEPSVQSRIFEPFFTTRPSGEGSGIGLSLVADLVHAVGGEIAVRSAPERGTTLSLCLPRACGADGADPAPVAAAAPDHV